MQETNLQKAERLIREINRIHAQYSQDYFETGKVAKVNLSRTLAHVPTGHILSYRLNLHEAINDYLAFADSGHPFCRPFCMAGENSRAIA